MTFQPRPATGDKLERVAQASGEIFDAVRNVIKLAWGMNGRGDLVFENVELTTDAERGVVVFSFDCGCEWRRGFGEPFDWGSEMETLCESLLIEIGKALKSRWYGWHEVLCCADRRIIQDLERLELEGA